MRIGVVADTHGSLPDSAANVLAGVDRIIHAGDVGSQRVLDELEAIAPLTAVRGNMDTGELEWRLLDTAAVRLGETRILVTHQAKDAISRGIPQGVSIVVSGHTHRATIERVGDILFVNPGSAGGKNRDGRGATAAIIDLDTDPPSAQVVDLP
jgi:putative phosphoesterase